MKIGNKISRKETLTHAAMGCELIWGILSLLSILLPIHSFTNVLFPNQVELLYFSIILLFIWSLLIIIRKQLRAELIFYHNSCDWIFYAILLYLYLRSGINVTANKEFVMQLYVSALAYFCFRNIQPVRLPLFVQTIVFAGTIQIVYSLLTQGEYLLFQEKLSNIHGSFMNSSVWGVFLVIQIILVIGSMLTATSLKMRILMSAAGVCFLVLLVTSHSRAGWLALACAIAYLAYYIPIVSTLHKQRFLILFFLIIGTAFSYSLYSYKKDSADGRILIWRVSYEMIKDKPLFGHGVEGFKHNYMQYQGQFFKNNSEQGSGILADNTEFAFNEYIKVTVEHGLIGLLLLLILFFKLLIGKRGSISYYSTLSKAGLVSWIVFAFFSYPFFLWQLTILFLFFLSINTNETKQPFRLSSQIRQGIYGLYMIGGIGAIIALTPHRQTIKEWNKTIDNELSMEEKVGSLQRLYPQLKNDSDFLFYYAKACQSLKCFNEAELLLRQSYLLHPHYENALALGEIFIEKRNITDATHYLQIAAYMIPHRIMPHYYLFRLYRDNGDAEKAHQEMRKIESMKVKVYFPEMNFIVKELKQYAIKHHSE